MGDKGKEVRADITPKLPIFRTGEKRKGGRRKKKKEIKQRYGDF